MHRLYIEDDAGNVRVVPIGDGIVTMGRAADNGIVLEDRNVSRHHARIRPRDGHLFLADAGSRYGVRLDGGRLDGEIELRPGDLFQIGDYRMKLLAQDTALSDIEDAVAPVEPSRRPTEIGIQPVRDGEPSGPDVGLMTLQEMEEVARLGWRSDFYDQDEPAARKRAIGHVLLLLLLVAMAAGLGFAYYTLYVADDVIVQPRTYVPVPAAPATNRAPGGPRE